MVDRFTTPKGARSSAFRRIPISCPAMKLTDLTVLLPCHSLEDFPTYYEGREADELLSSWCALWHPALLASAAAMPGWHRIDVPPETLSGRLMVVAPFCADRLPAGFAARAKTEGGHFVRSTSLAAAVADCLAGLDSDAAAGATKIDEQLAADFLALGFCRLQIELLTRQMRYSVNIDETHFQNETLAAAQAAIAYDEHAARQHLGQCFDTLYEARKHFYPVDVHLIDLLLLAPTTLGEALQTELSGGPATNLLLTSSLLETISREHSGTWSSLLSAIDEGLACVLGGEQEERELPLVPMEVARASIDQGVRQYERLLGCPPKVYARRRDGLWPGLPQILVKYGFQGALHFTLDDGRFPLAGQCKTRWEGLDGSVIDIFARLPSDATKPESFLGLSRKLADSMDSDHVATMAFAHWPGQVSPWYTLLRRITQLSPVLGKFMTLDDYFSHTDMPGRMSKFEADEYRTSYLKQAIIRKQSDPISSFVRIHKRQAERAATRTISTLGELIVGKTSPAGEPSCESCEQTGNAENLRQMQAALEAFAIALPRHPDTSGSPRMLIVNPLSFARRIGVELPPLENLPAVKMPVVAAATAGDRKFAVVEVPPLGFAWIEPSATPPAASKAKPLAQENVLRNEFFEVTISRGSGGIQSIFSFKQRGNQLSQQIAVRVPAAPVAPGEPWRDPQQEASYTTMVAESVEVTAACSAFGEIVSRGGLIDSEGRRVAGFRQTTQVWAGSRVVHVDIELDSIEEPRADPWNSYYAARFAWPQESADLYRGVGLARQKTTASRVEAPEYIEIDNGVGRISLLTGGLPYHQRIGARMLDSLLVVRGETARRFLLAIAIDHPQPAAAAQELIAPPAMLIDTAGQPKNSSGWFFHLDAKNVVATHWQPLAEDQTDETQPNTTLPVKGFRARLLESAGRSGRVTLRTFRNLSAARQIDFRGETMLTLPVDGDKITLDFAANEWIEVEAVWA